MSFCDEAVPVKIGPDGLAREDWDEIHALVQKHANDLSRRAGEYPSISARQAAANAEAMRLRVWNVWRWKMGYAGKPEGVE